MRLRASAALVVAAWALAANAARAAEPETASLGTPERVELRYLAEAGCPTQAAFVNEVAARIRRPVEWVLASASTQMIITLTRRDDHTSGKLEVVRPGVDPTRREFVASTCAEVGSALALVAALTLDPTARTEALPPAAATPQATEPPAVATPEPVPEPPVSRPPPPVALPPERPRGDGSPSRSSTGYVAWLGPTVGAASGYAPQPLVTLGVTLGVSAAVRRGFSPSFQLTPLWGKTGSTGPSATEGDFSWAMARLEACPTRFLLVTSLALEPCLAAEVGRLSARGAEEQIAEPTTVQRSWAAAGATLSLHFSQGRWFSRLGAHALVPATRDEFVFRNPDRSVHQASAIVLGGNLSLGIELGR